MRKVLFHVLTLLDDMQLRLNDGIYFLQNVHHKFNGLQKRILQLTSLLL